jgi:O-antigen/teichoic acid export membrane protein
MMRRYFAALVEQALWSLLNLGVNLALARFAAPQAYGGFVFWANAGFILASLQNAVTVCHLQTLPPGDGRSPERLATERLMHVVNAIFLALTAAGALAAATLMPGGNELHAPAAALFLPAFLLQQYVRALAFSRGRAAAAAIQTGLVLAIAAPALALLTRRPAAISADAILLVMAGAYGVVGLAAAVRATAGQFGGAASASRLRLGDYMPFARQSGWIFLGVTTTELLVRFYAFVVAARYGPAALAMLAATQLLLRPIPLLAGSWSMAARGDLAVQRDARRWDRFLRLLRFALAGGVVVAFAWTLLVRVGWSALSEHVFAGKYADAGWLVVIWGVSSALTFGQVVLNAGLQVLRAFKPLAIANGVAAVAGAGAILLMIQRFGPAGAVVGTSLAQGLEIAVMAAVLLRALARQRRV